MAAGARQLHQLRVLRRSVGAHPCALVCVGLPLHAPGRGASGVAHPQLVGELLSLDVDFVPKNGGKTWDVDWFWSGMARAVRPVLKVSLLAAVDFEEGGTYP